MPTTEDRTLERFWAKVNKNGPISARRPDLGPCWLWKPQGSVGGYGQFRLNGRQQLAHRAAYMLLVGPIPPKLTIDHLCCVRPCVNPTHLEPVTLAENLRRMRVWADYENGGAAFQRDKTHCPSDHEYTPGNTRITKDGRRCCRTCEREHMAAWREANPLPPKPDTEPKLACVNGHDAAEFGVIRQDIWSCGECDREKVRRYRARKRGDLPPLEPKPPRETCINGHPWTEGNIYRNPSGEEFCRECHREACRTALQARREFAAQQAPMQLTLI